MSQFVISPDGSQVFVDGSWRTMSPDRAYYWDGSAWVALNLSGGSGAATATTPGTAPGASTSWGVPQPVPRRQSIAGGVGGGIVLGCLGIIGVIVLLLVVGGVMAGAGSPAASVTSWTVGSAHVEGTVTGGSSGCTDMHVQIKLTDKNDAVQHTYDLQVNDVGAHQTKAWQSDVSGLGPEPITADITSATATADCRDQHQ